MVLIIGLISIFVKHNIYFSLHACSATVRLLHSWADESDKETNRFSCEVRHRDGHDSDGSI